MGGQFVDAWHVASFSGVNNRAATAATPSASAPGRWWSPPGAPVARPPAGAARPDRLAFVGPAPAAPSSNGGVFDIFGALRPVPKASGLFLIDRDASGLAARQPRRLGTAVNNFGLVWRFDSTLLGFARQEARVLALHSIDPTSGAVQDRACGCRLVRRRV
jgi:hypothetical protein